MNTVEIWFVIHCPNLEHGSPTSIDIESSEIKILNMKRKIKDDPELALEFTKLCITELSVWRIKGLKKHGDWREIVKGVDVNDRNSAEELQGWTEVGSHKLSKDEMLLIQINPSTSRISTAHETFSDKLLQRRFHGS